MNNYLLFLISLTLLSSASAVIFRHEVHWRESLKTKLVRQGLWKEYVAHKQGPLHGKFSNFKSSSQNIGEDDDIEYYVNITIGTPQQLFTVVLDTTSGITHIPDINCFSCQNMRKFNSSKSSTYQKTDHLLYNNASDGFYGQDFVRFGNSGTNQLTIPKATFAQVITNIDAVTVDGIMGLGFTAQNSDNVDPPIITAIKSGILDSPVVTLFLKGQGVGSQSNNGGMITYGALDTVNCDRNINYEPLSDPNSFQVSVKKASLGSSQFSGNWNASIDTFTSLLWGPQLIVDAFTKEVNAKYNLEIGYYAIDCKTKFDLNFTIGATVYTLTEKEMVVKYGNDMCSLSIDTDATETWTFGTPWLRTFCNVLDYGNKRIGFANVSSS